MYSQQADLDKNTTAQLIQNLIHKLKACYVFPEIAGQIGICLQDHLKKGDYSDITEGEFLALALTLHMQEISIDRHLWVKWHPEPLPDDEGPLRHNQAWQDERKLEARLDNYGIHRVERLPGNVGYIDIHYFHRPAWGGSTVTAAMNFLENTSSLIFDLRKCLGGYPGMITLMSSYLFEEEPVHLSSIYWRDEDITQQYWTLPYISGKRFTHHPVYILTSKNTFSGGEEFAYNLKAQQRAILVGETTGGGAHPGASFRLHSHFEAFIPIGRVINPITGTNWEGCGVTPNISVPQQQAFTVAYQSALKSIIANPGEMPSESFMALAEEAKVALKKTEPG